MTVVLLLQMWAFSFHYNNLLMFSQCACCTMSNVVLICRLWAFSFQRNTQIKPLEALQWMKGMREYYMCKYGNYSDEEYLMK